MEALFEKIVFPKTQAFLIREFHFATFWYPWHYHPEFEMTCILKSKGQRFIGDSIGNFEEGDLVLIGPNLPHFWRNDDGYHKTKEEGAAHCITLQFRADLFSNDFLKTTELDNVKRLFSKSKRGIQFTGATSKKAISKMRRLLTLDGMDRIIAFLALLKLLSETDEMDILCRSGYVPALGTYDLQRMDKVYQYALMNFRSGANLGEAADIACLKTASFCRFFKLRANKTFMQFINELRVNHANKLLKETGLPISTIGFESGFQNLSNFNRQFKKILGKTPREIRSYFR